ncbi:serum response factor-binding protein 1 [Pelodytes ibericus]
MTENQPSLDKAPSFVVKRVGVQAHRVGEHCVATLAVFLSWIKFILQPVLCLAILFNSPPPKAITEYSSDISLSQVYQVLRCTKKQLVLSQQLRQGSKSGRKHLSFRRHFAISRPFSYAFSHVCPLESYPKRVKEMRVVKMRKDVKKVKVLTIRRLSRHIAKLKAKKGSEELLLKNQRRAQRLLEEIHAMKDLKPDDVTKTALQKEINFDKVCKKPNSTAENRAIARLATYPLLKHKITAIKEAIKAFKEARQNLPEGESNENPDCKQPESIETKSSETEKKCKQKKVKQKRKSEKPKTEEGDLKEQVSKRLVVEPNCIVKDLSDKEGSLLVETNVEAPPSQSTTEVKVTEIEMTSKEVEEIPKAVESVPEKKTPSVQAPGSDFSDIENSDKEHKEYFDDSTEERFYKQSSGFEDSDSDGEDDFFIGKIRRTKKKKSDKNDSEGRGKKESQSKDTEKCAATHSVIQKGNPVSKTAKLQSVFCKSLSDTKQKSSYMKRETNLPFVKNGKSVVPQANKQERKPLPTRGRAVIPRGKSQGSQQPLHPSWEASRRRKEQQSQITAFQGKKIIFDD